MSRYTYVWAFQVRRECLDQFQMHYGEGGSWVELFRRADGYVGTRLLRDRADPCRFLTIDTWRSVDDHRQFGAGREP